MKAYYIHWNYPSTADDTLYYSGTDDEKFFHKKENAQKYMEEQLRTYKQNCELLMDCPNSGYVCEREIIFED